MSEKSEASNGKKFARTAADAGTIALSFTFGIAACHAGPVVAGVVAAAVTLPIIFSTVGIMIRHGSIGSTSEFANCTGLQTTGKMLKAAFSNATAALILSATPVIVGGVVGLLNADARQTEIEQREYAQMMSKLPVLPSDTVIETVKTRALDLCVNRRGDKIRNGQEIPYKYDGVEYKIICR